MKFSRKPYFALFIPIILFSSCVKTPNACFSVEGTQKFNSGDTLQFINCSLRGTNYFWDFGDGNTSTEINPKHVYERSGNYEIVLIATSENGKKEDTQIQFLEVWLKLPSSIILHKVVLKNFSNVFTEPDVYMKLTNDSTIMIDKNQVYPNCKQGVPYTFDAGFPLTFTGDELTKNTKIEFLNDDSSGLNSVIGYQNMLLINSYFQYVSSGSTQDSIGLINSTGLEIYLFPEFIFD